MPIYARHVSLLVTALLVAAYAYAYFFVNVGDNSKGEGSVANMINPLLAAMVLVTTYLYSRTDKSCDLLIAIEKLYQECKAGCEILESDELYNEASRHLVQWSEVFIADLEIGDPYRKVFKFDPDKYESEKLKSAAKEWPENLRDIDRLIRFYLLLRSFLDTGQIGVRVLRQPYRYMLSHYFNPRRKAFMVYVHLHYPNIRTWLSDATNPAPYVTKPSTSSNFFFQPQEFNWRVVKVESDGAVGLGSRVAPAWLGTGAHDWKEGGDSWRSDGRHLETSSALSL